MNLKTVFRIGAIVLLINGLGGLFATEMFMEAANFTMSPSLLTIGQFMGVTFLIMALIGWRTADLANNALPAFGQLYAITQAMWVAIIGYHIAIGAAGGPTAYANIVITALLGILFFFYSKK
ncbi:MAG: hypothetical protein CMB82_02785 [Flammeovirgaceae bacterium]|nr:hypothetical protein [Flammeovirgaceae bacterium]|tara:strand:+ start:1347 stop:1712 length:366 start_codon:yes stop_codon:yes gene_type:complete